MFLLIARGQESVDLGFIKEESSPFCVWLGFHSPSLRLDLCFGPRVQSYGAGHQAMAIALAFMTTFLFQTPMDHLEFSTHLTVMGLI